MSSSTQNKGPIPATCTKAHPKLSNVLTPYEDLKSLNVLVFGPTGAGKSTIINHLTNNSAKLPIGHDLESCTADITPVSVKHKGRMITFLDTPGFDDSERTPAEHLVLLMARLDEMHTLFKGRPHIHGVFYIHRITDNKITKSAKTNIRMFQKLLGDHVLKNLVFVTNMWRALPKDNHIQFEQSLIKKDEYFGAAIKKGARAGAAYRICEDATPVQVQQVLLDVFLTTSPEVLQIQQEMAASAVVDISSTEAGKVIREELRVAEQDLRKRLGNLENQLEDVPDVEKEERKEILTDIMSLKVNLDKLKEQDSLLDANTAFLREGIPRVMAEAWFAASAGVVVSTGVEITTAAVGAVTTVVGLAGVVALGMGIIMVYAQWRNAMTKK